MQHALGEGARLATLCVNPTTATGCGTPTDAQIEAAMTNLCRCGTYNRVRRAIRRAAGMNPDGRA